MFISLISVQHNEMAMLANWHHSTRTQGKWMATVENNVCHTETWKCKQNGHETMCKENRKSRTDRRCTA